VEKVKKAAYPFNWPKQKSERRRHHEERYHFGSDEVKPDVRDAGINRTGKGSGVHPGYFGGGSIRVFWAWEIGADEICGWSDRISQWLWEASTTVSPRRNGNGSEATGARDGGTFYE
jgi:hypothetical protein